MAMTKKKGITKKNNNGFLNRYKKYVETSVMGNTTNNISELKNKGEQYEKELKNHLTTFKSNNETMIASYIYSLLLDACFNTSKYKQDRINTLKELYKFLDNNHSWAELSSVYSHIYKTALINGNIPTNQLQNELMDMFRLHLPYRKVIGGVDSKKNQPILIDSPFYLTKDLLTHIENPFSTGRKKSRELEAIKHQVAEIYIYTSQHFGIYDETTIDLLPTNGLKHTDIPTIQLPRTLGELEDMTDFIEKNRRYTLNPNGVVVECFNCGDIDRIVFIEKNKTLLWKVFFNKPGTVINKKEDIVDDVNEAEFSGHFDLGLIPHSTFSGHNSYIDFEFTLYPFLLECFAEIACGAESLSKVFGERNMINVGTIQSMEEESDIRLDVSEGQVGIRLTPRHVFNVAKSNSDGTKQGLNKELDRYFISGHLRKLPKTHSSSQDALLHAMEYGIDIPDGYTFVRPYSNNQEDKIRTVYLKRI